MKRLWIAAALLGVMLAGRIWAVLGEEFVLGVAKMGQCPAVLVECGFLGGVRVL